MRALLYFLIVVIALVTFFPELFPKDNLKYEEAIQKAPGKIIEINGKKVHYIAQGPQEAPPVILIHGFLYHTVLWERNIGPLSRNFRVYALDLFGFGYSERAAWEPFSYKLYAEQVKGFMDALGIKKAHLIGQSLGGGVVLRFATDYKDSVARAILIAPASLPNPRPLSAELLALPLVGEFLWNLPGTDLPRHILETNFFFDRRQITPDYLVRYAAPLSIRHSFKTLLEIFRNFEFDKQADVVERYGKRSVPTLFLWGRQEKALPLKSGQRLQRMIPGSRIHVLEKAGHVPNHEQADRFNALTAEFLKGD
jgi:pimeloyl-ACP methyl ester carboxylesterase